MWIRPVATRCYICLAIAAALAPHAPGSLAQERNAVLHPFQGLGVWGYMDSRGTKVIPPQFTWARDFFEDRAAVSTGTRSGYIRPDGSWACVLPHGAFPARRFSEGRAWFRQDDRYGCVDAEGNILLAPTYDDVRNFSEGLAAVGARPANELDDELSEHMERYGYVDRDCRLVIRLEYASAGSFGCGLARTRRVGESWHYMNRDQQLVFALDKLPRGPRNRVLMVGDFKDRRVPVYFHGRGRVIQFAGFLDTSGKLVGRTFDTVKLDGFCEGMAAVRIDRKFGFVDTDGCIRIREQFDEVGSFAEGLCRVRVGEAWRYIDKTGRVAVQPRASDAIWNDAEDFHGGLARIHIGGRFEETYHGPQLWAGGAWYYIDRQGNIVGLCRQGQDEDHLFGKEAPGVLE